jgi:hypothetical protein
MRMNRWNRGVWLAPARCSLLALTIGVAGSVPPAFAQTASGTWEVEFHAGGTLGGIPANGSAAALPVGEPFSAGGGPAAFPSRRVSSWYFGDGATLFNEVAADPTFSRSATVIPLDPVLAAPLGQRRGGGTLGIRVRRIVSSRFAAEFSVDYNLARVEIDGEGLTSIEASRASFASAWRQFQTTGPFFESRVTSTADVREGRARELVSTGALNISLKADGVVIPYVTAGAGVISRVGDAPRVTLSGNYQFRFLGTYPVNESDTVTIRDARPDRSFVGVVGAGARVQATRRWGIRFDARSLLGTNRASTRLDANPSVAVGTPPINIWTGTTPSIQFANQLPPRSTLSGPRLVDLETFKGSGARRQLTITTAVYWRF